MRKSNMLEAIKHTPRIFIICGSARQGKDTLGSYIREYYESNYEKKATVLQYSYYIKDYAKQLTGWDGRDETKPRTVLQQLGTDVIRKEIDSNFFAHRMVEDIQVFSFYYDVLTITDGRFADEVTYVKDRFPNAYVIHIVRPNYDDGLTEEQKHHATEQGLVNFDGYDATIINDGTLDELREKAIKLVEEVEHED